MSQEGRSHLANHQVYWHVKVLPGDGNYMQQESFYETSINREICESEDTQ